MSLLSLFLPLVLIAVICAPLFLAYRQKVNGKTPSKIKRSIIINLSAFAVICLIGVIFPLGGLASAAAATGKAAIDTGVGAGLAYIAAAIAVGSSGIGGGIAVANGSAAAIGAITEEPKVFGRAILFVGLGEGVALYGFIIALMIVLKF